VTTYNKLGGDMVMAKETMFITQMEEDAIEGEILAHALLISKSQKHLWTEARASSVESIPN
jgi:hypothetical protein